MAKYYYLISTLADPGQRPGPNKTIDADAALKAIAEGMATEDEAGFRFLLLPQDNHNLVSAILHHSQEMPYVPIGPSYMPEKEILRYKQFQPGFPGYMFNFLAHENDRLDDHDHASLTNLLHEYFLEEVEANAPTFLKKYFAFAHVLDLLKGHKLAETFANMDTPDFAREPQIGRWLRQGGQFQDRLQMAYPWLANVWEKIDQKDPKASQLAVEQARWDFVSEETATDPFSASHLFARFVQYLDIAKWNRLAAKSSSGFELWEERLLQH